MLNASVVKPEPPGAELFRLKPKKNLLVGCVPRFHKIVLRIQFRTFKSPEPTKIYSAPQYWLNAHPSSSCEGDGLNLSISKR